MPTVLLLMSLCAGQTPISSPPDAVLRWNNVALDAIRAEKTPPPKGSRQLAILHTAIYDAVNAIYQTHRPYRFSLRATEPINPDAAVSGAAHRVLMEFYPDRADALNDALDDTLAGVRPGAERDRGMRLGKYVAERMLALRAADGSSRKADHPGSLAIGIWRPTPSDFKPALAPNWPMVTPFGARNLAEFRPPPPPSVTSAVYGVDFNEVKRLGGKCCSTRTADQTQIAKFWDDGPGTASPPGHWNVIAQTVARSQGNTLPENARLFALLNIAMADAAIGCWDCKYRFRYWRPVTAIHEADGDGNPLTQPDPCWEALLNTPPFPSYTSGHSTFSGAAATVLAIFFGRDNIAFNIGSDGLPCVRRSYTGFWAAALEAGKSRIYGGIHYEFDNREGLTSGQALAAQICGEVLIAETTDLIRTSEWRRKREKSGALTPLLERK